MIKSAFYTALIAFFLYLTIAPPQTDASECIVGTEACNMLDLSTHTGIIQGGVEVNNESTTATETDAVGQWVFMTGAKTRTLPLIVSGEGQSICYYTVAANILTIDTNISDKIFLNGTALDNGDTIDSSGVPGEFVCLISNGTDWYTAGIAGTWIDGGAT